MPSPVALLLPQVPVVYVLLVTAYKSENFCVNGCQVLTTQCATSVCTSTSRCARSPPPLCFGRCHQTPELMQECGLIHHLPLDFY